MTGNVDDAGQPPAGEPKRSEAEVDRHPALLLLFEPIGLRSREGADERCLPVIDVAGCADDEMLHTADRSRRTGLNPAGALPVSQYGHRPDSVCAGVAALNAECIKANGLPPRRSDSQAGSAG